MLRVDHCSLGSRERQRKRQHNEQQRREIEEQPAEGGITVRSERTPFPRRAATRLESRRLALGRRAEEGGESVWDPEQGDRCPGSCWEAGIACQPLGEREAIMCSLCS